MRKLLTIILGLLTLISCGTPYTAYNIPLKAVECPENAKIKYGEKKISSVLVGDGTTSYSYEDDYIHILWLFGSEKISFCLTNKTGFSLKLAWDDMAYIDYTGQSRRVIHSGVKYDDRNLPQATSVVAKGAKLDDVLMPANNIYYISGRYGGWQEKLLFPQFKKQEQAERAMLGKQVGILFPIIIQDVQNEYIFYFTIDGVNVVKKINFNSPSQLRERNENARRNTSTYIF